MEKCEEKECSKYDEIEDNNCKRYLDIKQVPASMCLKMKTEPVADVLCSDGLDAHALKGQLDRLLCVVNAVTCPHRHGQPVRPKDLTRLANRQIEVEEALREMGN